MYSWKIGSREKGEGITTGESFLGKHSCGIYRMIPIFEQFVALVQTEICSGYNAIWCQPSYSTLPSKTYHPLYDQNFQLTFAALNKGSLWSINVLEKYQSAGNAWMKLKERQEHESIIGRLFNSQCKLLIAFTGSNSFTKLLEINALHFRNSICPMGLPM